MKSSRFFLILFILNSFAHLSSAQMAYSDQPTSTTAIDLTWISQTMDRYMEENNIPALVTGIVRDGKIEAIISKGTMKRGSEIKVNENTVFQLASLSKTFTSLIANHLVAEGKLDMHAPIITYLPEELPAATRQNLAHLTLQDILHHRAGLPRDAKSAPATPFGRPMIGGYPEADLLKDLNALKFDSTAEQTFSYSNFGYGLAGYIMERASGQSYETLLQTYIARKLDMPNTTASLNSQQQQLLATPYMPHNRKKETKPWEFGKLTPAGGVFSSVADLCQLMIRQMEAYTQYDQTGTPCPFILTQYKVPMGSSGSSNYGFGLMESRNSIDSTITHLGHGGDVDGFVSNYSFSPTHGIGLILLSSSGGNWFWELERVLNMKLLGLPIREAISIDKKLLKRYVGKYDFGHVVMTIHEKDDHLWSSMPGYPWQKLYPEAKNKFFYHAFNAQIEFILNDKNEIEKVAYVQNGKTTYPKKVK